MAKRQINRLTAPEVRALTKPGRHADGGGLYLIVDASGARRWAFLFRWNGKLKEMGLGGFDTVGLAKARTKAAACRDQLDAGVNPNEARQSERAVPTYGEMADKTLALVEAKSRNAKHVAGWKLTLGTYCEPIRAKPVDQVTRDDIVELLRPFFETRPETASRMRGRIERVLDAAKAAKWRSGENPAAWRGNLEHEFAGRHKLTRGHHKALAFAQVPAFVADLRERDAMAARALEFIILTAARSWEVRGATWSEIDLAAKVWTVPANRMKAGREHRVPLSTRAVKILETVGEGTNRAPDSLVFPGPKKRGSLAERPLSINAFRALMARMDVTVTAHGFRSSFRDWAGEASSFPRELAEAALAHTVGDATERAYRRGDALEKRRRLMEAWDSFLSHSGAKSGNVRPMLRGAA
jgi:integrase